ASYGNELYLGHNNVFVAGQPSAFLARWNRSGAPWVSVPPVPTSAACGGAAALSVTAASGYSGLSYQWRHDGLALTDGPTGSGSSISGAQSESLSITGLTNHDLGTYDCLVSNSCGSSASNSATLSISNCCGSP